MSISSAVQSRRRKRPWQFAALLLVATMFALVVSASPTITTPAKADGNPAGDRLLVTHVQGTASTAQAVQLLSINGSGESAGSPILLPTTVDGLNHPFSLAGDEGSTGSLALSADGRYVVAAGYSVPAGGPAPRGTLAADFPRVVARVDAAGNVDTSTTLGQTFSAHNIRGVTTDDGTRYWVSGHNNDSSSSPQGGVVYAEHGASTAVAVASGNQGRNNTRSTRTFNDRLYITSDRSQRYGLSEILNVCGDGLPTASGCGAFEEPGAMTVPMSGFVAEFGYELEDDAPADFVFLARDGGALDALYVVVEGAGIHKFYLDDGSWTHAGRVLAGNYRKLTGKVDGDGNVRLYAVLGNSGGNAVVSILDESDIDDGAVISGSNVETIATAPAGTVFRGVAFAPEGEDTSTPSIRITEWMYQGADNGPEFVELTNVGDTPVDMDGWSYDDDNRRPGQLDLSSFGIVQPGESVVFVENTPEQFRTNWALCEAVKVIGPYTNNLGRNDEINIYDANDELVDRLTYGDQDFPGSIRTQGASGWVSEAGLGANDATEWTLSTVGDAEGSYAGFDGSIGSPGISTHGGFDPCDEGGEGGAIRITEWMYQGANNGPEFVELTNVGDAPVNMTGWSYDDDNRRPGQLDLSSFGIVQPGESVVFVENTPEQFRTNWGLCEAVKVIGSYTNNLGRNDEINIYDANDELVDRLTYGDQDFPGSIRTQGASGWVSEAGLGENNALEWTLSTVGDAEGSYAGLDGSIGSPGISTHGGFDPCEATEPGDNPTVNLAANTWVGSIGDPANPVLTLTVADADTPVEDLVVTAASANQSIIPDGNITITGAGAERTVAFEPAGRGVTIITFTVTDPDDNTGTAVLSYGASNQAPDPSGRYHHGISDASAALDVGDGYMILVDDETNTIFLHQQEFSGPPVKTWDFTAQQLGTGSEIDFESIARSGDLLVLSGSHGNNRSGAVRTERRTFVAATITGSGAETELEFLGRYNNLWDELRAWDQDNGHGLGADALGFIAGTASGVEPNPPVGFNIEAMAFAPDGETLYLGFRAPTIEVDDSYHGLIVPVLNVEDIIDGAPGTGPAQFGAPILLDLDGRSLRSIGFNEQGGYLISAGPSPQNGSWALYTWNGNPASQPQFNRLLPDVDLLTGGTWEGIVAAPHPLLEGAEVRIVADSGDTNYYGTGMTKDIAPGYQKSYSQVFTLAAVPPVIDDEARVEVRFDATETVSGETVTAQVLATTEAPLSGIDFTFSFDPTVLQVANITPADGWSTINCAPESEPDECLVLIDNTTGTVTGRYFRLAPNAPVSGEDLPVVTVTFNAIAASEGTSIDLTSALLSTPDGASIEPVELIDSGDLVIEEGLRIISGTVLLQGRTGHAGTQVFFAGEMAATSESGAFLIQVEPGANGTLVAVHPGYLRAVSSPFTVNDHVVAEEIMLRGGDATGDTEVNIFDLALVAGHYGQAGPFDLGDGPVSPVQAITPDVNGDDEVNLFDLTITAGNYGLADPSPWALVTP